MNQILSVEMPSKNKKKSHKKINIGSIIIFFCIILLIFGILMIGIGIFSKIKDSEEKKGEFIQSKPKIEIIQKLSRLEINVTSEKPISKIVYKWNNGEETTVNGNNEKSMNIEKIKVPLGNNIFTITATDTDGVSESFEREYVGFEEYTPKVHLKFENSKYILVCESETIIKQISYYYDDKSESTQPINSKKGEVSIGVIPGEHKLTVRIVDENGREYIDDSHKVSAPEVSVVTDGHYFIIKGNDVTGLKKVEILFNGEIIEKKIDSNNYEENLKLEDGENKIIVRLTNGKGITNKASVKWEKTSY